MSSKIPSPKTPDPHEAPRAELWLKVMMSAFIPLIVAMLVPASLKILFLIAAGALVVAGLVLLLRRGLFS